MQRNGSRVFFAAGVVLLAVFPSVAGRPDPDGVPDFPADLRRQEPVEDIADAVVYTMNEFIRSDYGLRLAAKTGSDVFVRGWFKWREAPDVAQLAHIPPAARRLGALFGGGITCSALYDGENGLSEQQWKDMATRSPAGELVDAWGTAGVRHGTLSNPAYLRYLMTWCRQQIDAGVDYLFMDEINAAHANNEGYDDYALKDFREYLLKKYCGRKGWQRDDPRWRERFAIDPADAAICPGGTMADFSYRAYLRRGGHIDRPRSPKNPLAGEWHIFTRVRDERAWKWLVDRIRAYARSKGRRVLISANGLAPHVDLQVLGVWNRWKVRGDRIDLAPDQIQEWASVVAAGRATAEQRVPVVFFHDWGMGGFPWMRVPPAERILWMRTRGAEIYAAGGFFAFPVHGPFGNDALRDGTIGEVARQSAYYHRCRDIYRGAAVLGFEPIRTDAPRLSTSLWRRDDPAALLLHVVNRMREGSRPKSRRDIEIVLPVDRAPRSVTLVSPDFAGTREAAAAVTGKELTVTIPALEAYAVAVLAYEKLPRVVMHGPRVYPQFRWTRPLVSEFPVVKGGGVKDCDELLACVQGALHPQMSNPPVFLVDMPAGGRFRVNLRAVAALGAAFVCAVDGEVRRKIPLPDRDGKNDAAAAEYDRIVEIPLSPGRHRIAIRNAGKDWFSVGWYSFAGS